MANGAYSAPIRPKESGRLSASLHFEYRAEFRHLVKSAEGWSASRDGEPHRGSWLCTVMFVRRHMKDWPIEQLRNARNGARAARDLRGRHANFVAWASAGAASASAISGFIYSAHSSKPAPVVAMVSLVAAVLCAWQGRQRLGYDRERVREKEWVAVGAALEDHFASVSRSEAEKRLRGLDERRDDMGSACSRSLGGPSGRFVHECVTFGACTTTTCVVRSSRRPLAGPRFSTQAAVLPVPAQGDSPHPDRGSSRANRRHGERVVTNVRIHATSHAPRVKLLLDSRTRGEVLAPRARAMLALVEPRRAPAKPSR
jgi:hypothetical protein